MPIDCKTKAAFSPSREEKPPRDALARTENLTRLEQTLRAAQKEATSRGAAITALQGVWEFLNAIPAFTAENLSFPISLLLGALQDLDAGRVAPLLDPAPIDHRKPYGSWQKVVRAVAIWAIDQLMEHGMSVGSACKFVAVELKRAGIPIDGRSDTPEWKTLKSWRADSSRLDKNDQERHTLAEFHAELDLPKGTPIRDVEKRLRIALPYILSRIKRGLE